MKVTKNLGFLLLGIWLVMTGLMHILSFDFPSSGLLTAGLAVASGIMIILGK